MQVMRFMRFNKQLFEDKTLAAIGLQREIGMKSSSESNAVIQAAKMYIDKGLSPIDVIKCLRKDFNIDLLLAKGVYILAS